MGEEMAYGVPHFSYTGCPVPDVYIYYVTVMIDIWDIVSTLIFFNNGLVNTPWTFSIYIRFKY